MDLSGPFLGHSPYGECGLKSADAIVLTGEDGSHSPYGECGLKYAKRGGNLQSGVSLPIRGVWIEIANWIIRKAAAGVTPHTGSVD